MSITIETINPEPVSRPFKKWDLVKHKYGGIRSLVLVVGETAISDTYAFDTFHGLQLEGEHAGESSDFISLAFVHADDKRIVLQNTKA